MGLTVIYDWRCDDCGAQVRKTEPTPSAAVSPYTTLAEGWVMNGRRASCPSCSEKRGASLRAMGWTGF